MMGVDATRTRVGPAAFDAMIPGGDARAHRPIVLAGRFEPSPEAMLVSPAPLFRRATAATALFSRAAATVAPAGTPELRLRLADVGGDRELWTRGTNTGASGEPEADTRPPVSYATARYHGPDTYSLDPSRGDPVLLRFHLAPHAGEHRFGAAAARGLAADHLEREMLQRIALRPVLFTWCAEIVGDAGEPDPASRHPPSEHACIHLGVVRLDRLLEGLWTDAARQRPPTDFTLLKPGSGGGRPDAAPNNGDPS